MMRRTQDPMSGTELRHPSVHLSRTTEVAGSIVVIISEAIIAGFVGSTAIIAGFVGSTGCCTASSVCLTTSLCLFVWDVLDVTEERENIRSCKVHLD